MAFYKQKKSRPGFYTGRDFWFVCKFKEATTKTKAAYRKIIPVRRLVIFIRLFRPCS